MKKTLLTISVSVISTCLTIFLLSRLAALEKESIHIAVAGPMSGPQEPAGQAMVRGIRLYMDNAGGIDGRKVGILVFDDEGKEKSARKAAFKIAENENIRLVLGHYHSATAIAAGNIYKKKSIAAITGSATAGSVTQGNRGIRVFHDICAAHRFDTRLGQTGECRNDEVGRSHGKNCPCRGGSGSLPADQPYVLCALKIYRE